MAISKAFLAAATRATFDPNKWETVGEPVNLKDIWKETHPGMYSRIDGDVAVVTSYRFEDGDEALSISVPMKNGRAVDLRLGSTSDLLEGDEVAVASITGQLLSKPGRDNIVRFDGVIIDEWKDADTE